MSKFINTSYKNTIDSLVEGQKERLKNPYYIFMDQKPTRVTYYNLNIHKSTLDESLKQNYSDLGSDEFKFNKVNDFYLYGIDRIITDLEFDDDVGLVSNTIEGEAYILPNTIVPRPNDYFVIDYVDHKFLFKVLSSTPDTIENGANFYKIEYKLDKLDDDSIHDQIADEFTMIINNIGTDFNSIIRNNDYNLIEEMDSITITLKKYYKALFYRDRVETFILFHQGYYFYDPFLIEFIKRHELLSGDGEYLFIDQQVHLNRTFSLDYDNVFFRMFETKKLDKEYLVQSQAVCIEDQLSILITRREDYQQVYYITGEMQTPNRYILDNLDDIFYHKLKSKTKFETNDYRNIIIKYFTEEDITSNDINILSNVSFVPSLELFYNIPLLIFVLECKIKRLMKKE